MIERAFMAKRVFGASCMIERVFDREIIDSILKHKSVKPFIGDDSTYSMDVEYPISESIFYLLATVGGERAGMFVGILANSVTIDAHSAVLPRFYGETAKELGKMAIDWFFSNGFMKIVGQTPVTNRLAIKYNIDLGFETEGINRKSIMKNGKLVDQMYFGLERDKWASKRQL